MTDDCHSQRSTPTTNTHTTPQQHFHLLDTYKYIDIQHVRESTMDGTIGYVP